MDARVRYRLIFASVLLFGLGACAVEDPVVDDGVSCPAPADGSVWVPDVTNADVNHHDGAVTVESEVFETTGALIGLADPAPTSKEVVFSFNVSSDLGASGSLQLVAENTSFPTGLSGGAYPVLTSLVQGANDWINIDRSGDATDCAGEGYFNCPGGLCSLNSGCGFSGTSAYPSMSKWVQRNFGSFAEVSTNTFPTCNWSGGSPDCAFTSVPFFSGGKLPTGSYTARYALLATNFSSVPDGAYSAGMRLTVLKKTDDTAASGAVDLNIIIVGSKNIEDSRTIKGKQNLNELFNHVYDHYNQSGTGVKLGAIQVVEWDCAQGGDSYASVSTGQIGTMVRQGSSLVPASSSGKALNVFIVSQIRSSSSTILGVSAALGGPALNGTGASGLIFASFDKLANFNPLCNGLGSCSSVVQEEDFVDMGSTVSHEIGHYLGLNHLTERAGTSHDTVADTPLCTNTQNLSSGPSLTHNSCKVDSNVHPTLGNSCNDVCSSYDGVTNFCAASSQCSFNHIMWYTSKNFVPALGLGDGNLFSTQTGSVLNYHPLIQ